MKKGFTLVELLATLILIGAISLMATTSLNKQIKNTNETSYKEFIATLELSTESYITGRKNDFSDLATENNPICINLKELVLTNYLNSKTKNPKTNTLVVNSSIYVKQNTDNTYTYSYIDNRLCTTS